MSVPAEPPIDLRISDITKNTISLAWHRPTYDGGSPITGYIIEKREGVSAKWSKANLTNVTDTRFAVTGLTQDESYEFRVMARNAVGSVSNPSITAGPATCVDTYGTSILFISNCVLPSNLMIFDFYFGYAIAMSYTALVNLVHWLR